MAKLLSFHGFILFFLVFTTFMSCRQEQEKKEQLPVPVTLYKAKTVNYQEIINTSGQVASRQEVKLSFKTGGIIRKMYYDEGDEVKKGDLLASLKMDEVKAHLQKAKLAMEKAHRDFKRAKNLYRDSVATLEVFQNAQTALNLAKSDMEVARFNFQHAAIKAPSNGLILRKLVEEQEIVSSGYPVYLFGSREKEWIVRVNVPDKDVINLAIGDTAEVLLDPYPDQVFPARITRPIRIPVPTV